MLSILGRLELCQNFKAFLQAHKTVTAQVLAQTVHGLPGESCHWSMRVVCVRMIMGMNVHAGACACVCMFMCVCSLCTCACVCIWSPEDNFRCSSGIFCDRISHWLAACRGRLSLLAVGPRDHVFTSMVLGSQACATTPVSSSGIASFQSASLCDETHSLS